MKASRLSLLVEPAKLFDMNKLVALAFAFGMSSSAFALEPQSVKLGADGWHTWWTTECGALVCTFQRAIQPMNEVTADVIEKLDEGKIYNCTMKAYLHSTAPTKDTERTRVWLAYDISNCTQQ